MKTLNITEIKRRLLVAEAEAWLNVSESGGENRGQVIEIFQKTIDKKAIGEPWCMCFVQYCIDKVDKMTNRLLETNMKDEFLNQLKKTEHCMTCWLNSPIECRLSEPVMGSIVIWQKKGSSNGHTGIVIAVAKQKGLFWTIEGNTGPDKEVQREGDGVYLKKRELNPVSGAFDIKGFLNPWPLAFSVSLQ